MVSLKIRGGVDVFNASSSVVEVYLNVQAFGPD